jgi:hypothetical protein
MTNDKQQTAVEWYIEQHNILAKISDSLSHGEIVKRISDIEKQAKEMEKEKIIKAYNQDLMGGLSGYRKFNDGEDYYNETYGGNKL